MMGMMSMCSFPVMAGLAPAIHDFYTALSNKSWIPATRAGMTKESFKRERLICFPSKTKGSKR